jgi:hypothetical protein
MIQSPSTSRKIRFEAERPQTLERTVNLTMEMDLTDDADSPGVERTVNVTADMNFTETGDSRFDQPMFFTPSQISTPIMQSVDNIYSKSYHKKMYLLFYFERRLKIFLRNHRQSKRKPASSST